MLDNAVLPKKINQYFRTLTIEYENNQPVLANILKQSDEVDVRAEHEKGSFKEVQYAHNSFMKPYGLISFVNKYIFGYEASFKFQWTKN